MATSSAKPIVVETEIILKVDSHHLYVKHGTLFYTVMKWPENLLSKKKDLANEHPTYVWPNFVQHYPLLKRTFKRKRVEQHAQPWKGYQIEKRIGNASTLSFFVLRSY